MAKKKQVRGSDTEAKAVQLPVRAKRLDSDTFAILSLAVIWLAAILLVNPRGNIPLNDDWCYGRAVFDLIRTHKYQPVSTVAMPIIGQVLWALPFCLVFGSTFVALRASTLVLAFGGILALYGLLREARMPRWAAFFGSVVLALNPLYLFLSHGFMTDVPSVAFMLIAMYCYVRALRTDSLRMILLGTVPACAAVLTRQIGLFVPVGFALAYLVGYGVRPKPLHKALLPPVAAVIAYQGFICWLKAAHRLPKLYNMQQSTVHEFLAGGPTIWMQAIGKIHLTEFMYVGLLLLPFLLLTISRRSHVLTLRQRTANLGISLLAGIAVLVKLASEQRWMPIDRTPGEYIWNFGMGPLTLFDTWDLAMPRHAIMPESFWIVVTIAAVVGGSLLVWHILAAVEMLFSRDRESVAPSDKAILVMLLTVAAMNMALLAPVSTFAYFDRYYLCIISVMLVVVALVAGPSVRINRLGLPVACIALLLMGWFGVGATHDYLAWNRLRWQAGHELMSTMNLRPQDFNAGNEFCAWYLWNNEKAWWDEVFNDYIVTFGPLPGYSIMKQYTYRRWMPPGEGAVYVLERQ